jgi:hypothetical protein
LITPIERQSSNTAKGLLLFLSIILLCILVLNFTGTVDRQAKTPIDSAFSRALFTYGVVRGINAVVSVIQGTEVSIEPAGIGVTLTPGEVFDPVNDLIEQFSWIVLVASTSLGAQKILVGIGNTQAIQLVVGLTIGLSLLLLWRRHLFTPAWRAILFRLSILAIAFRFLIPVLVLANEMVYRAFLDEQYQESYSELKQTEADVRAMQDSENVEIPTDGDNGILSQLSRIYDRTAQTINVNARLAEYEARLSNASEHIIDLIVVFMLQTIVFPVLFLWLGLRLVRLLISSNFLLLRQSTLQP